MAGLMDPQGAEPTAAPTAAPAASAPSAPPAGSDDTGDEGEALNVTPEEQQAYDKFVKDGLALLYAGGKVRPTILKLLDDDPTDLVGILGDQPELKNFSPVVALAGTAVVVVLEIVRRAGGDKPEDAIVFHGGKEILEELANLADVAKIHDFTQDELNKAFFLACDLYRETASAEGLIDTKQLAEEFQAIKAADQAGAFGGSPSSGGLMNQPAPASPAPEPDQDTPQQDQSQDPAMNPDAPDDQEQRR